jgi:hypothetical protein
MSQVITYTEVVAFIMSIVAFPQLWKSHYLKWFPLLLFIVVAVEVVQTFFREFLGDNNAAIYNIQIPLQHLLYMLILYQAMTRPIVKKMIAGAAVFFMVFTFMTVTFYTAPNKFNVLSYWLGATIIIVAILCKLYEMLQSPTDFNFLKTPFFYILFACLLFNMATLPYFLMSNWLYFAQANREIIVIFVTVMSVFNIIMYSTYALVFLWMKVRKASY